MKKIFISIILVVASVLYIYSRKPVLAPAPGIPSSVTNDINTITAKQDALSAQIAALEARIAKLDGAPVTSPAPSTSAPPPKPTPPATGLPQGSAPTSVSTSGYKDGTYTGSVADAFYGQVQVQVVIKNGSITNVTFLSYPSDRSTSRFINGQAMPLLTQEAISAQSANVNTVSGATFTSQAFKESLAVALASAKN